MKLETSVKQRYADAAAVQEAALCCPVEYDPKYLEVIPQEVIEKDYGCGDPSQWVNEGDTVLDLGSGTGKICFIASQVVGKSGKVIGVDMTDDMLEVAERNAPIVAQSIGYSNVEFRKGRIQDLALDLRLLEESLLKNPIKMVEDWVGLDDTISSLRSEKPLVEAGSVDAVVSNCVLNLVNSELKPKMFAEIYRVLKRGGRAVISDIVADEEVPEHLQDNAHLWSGCISGAMTERAFLEAFEEAGFYGVEFVKFESEPWQTVEGIEFRSVTVRAWKGKEGECLDKNQAVIYKGPFKKVLDDDGHAMERGKRYAVCERTYEIYKKPPYSEFFEHIEPLQEVPQEDVKQMVCVGAVERHPRETKGAGYSLTTEQSACSDGVDCC